MSVDDDSVETESLQALFVELQVVTHLGGLGLSKTVGVEDEHQVIQVIVASEVDGLPDGAFCALSVADEAVHPEEVME